MSAAGDRGRIRIGISGWRYAGWRGIFYPRGLQQRRELEFASRLFPSIEINGTFYSLQRPEFFRAWAAETPDDFVFALKGGRFITHMRKLLGVETALANFFASGVLELGAKLGPILWQLPPQLKFRDSERFEEFFGLLPRTTRKAARLAKRCDDRLLQAGRASFEVRVEMPLRHAIEVRDESFATPEFIDLLRRHEVGLVVADTVEWPLLMDVTADLVYVRLHGSEQLYSSGYEAEAIEVWARRVVAFSSGELAEGRYAGEPRADGRARDVYVYFDNDIKVRAPYDAQALAARVDQLLGSKGKTQISFGNDNESIERAGPQRRT